MPALNAPELNELVTRVTAFFSFEELKVATDRGYRPTLRGVPASKAKRDVAFASAEKSLADELEARGIAVFRGCAR